MPAYVESLEAQRERIWRVLASSETAMRVGDLAERVCLSPSNVRYRLQELIRRGRATNMRGWYRATGRGAE